MQQSADLQQHIETAIEKMRQEIRDLTGDLLHPEAEKILLIAMREQLTLAKSAADIHMIVDRYRKDLNQSRRLLERLLVTPDVISDRDKLQPIDQAILDTPIEQFIARLPVRSRARKIIRYMQGVTSIRDLVSQPIKKIRSAPSMGVYSLNDIRTTLHTFHPALHLGMDLLASTAVEAED